MKNIYFTLYYNICGQIVKNGFFIINIYFLKYFILKINDKVHKTLIRMTWTNMKYRY